MTEAAVQRRLDKLQSILEVAKALTAERHLERLLGLVVDAAATVAEADRCTLFVADRDRGELWSKVAHGARDIRIPLGAGIAGAVAAKGAPVQIDDAYADPRFNQSVDHETGYRTRSILAVPMRNTRGEVVGVLEALNRRDGPFTAEDEELLGALAGPAASAIENALLNEEIERRLFEGFVQASVLAIEQREPTTAGHSGRVALLTLALARAVEKAPPAEWRGVAFDAAALQQLRYAALLHDFGKVGVRENVLVKAEKLHPHEMEIVRARFELARVRRVPEIARGHHEKLDGRGYPQGVPASGIPVETRMMTIADVYDALTASDRPYKKALRPEEALGVLGDEARRGQVDAPLFAVFVEAGVWREASRR